MSSDNKPKYADLVKESILALKERGGSSLAAIKKFIGSKYPTFELAPVKPYLSLFASVLTFLSANHLILSNIFAQHSSVESPLAY
jgi:hypothetical protein